MINKLTLSNGQADRLEEILAERKDRDAYVTIENASGSNFRVTLRNGLAFEEKWQITSSDTKWQED